MTRLIGHGLIPVPVYEGSDALNVFLTAIKENGRWDWDHCCDELNQFLCVAKNKWQQDVTARLHSGTLVDLVRESVEGTLAVKVIAAGLIIPRLEATFSDLGNIAFLAAAEKHKSLGIAVSDWFEEQLDVRKESYRMSFTHISMGELNATLSAATASPFRRYLVQAEIDRRNKRQRTAASNRGIREEWQSMPLKELVEVEPSGKVLRKHWRAAVVSRAVSTTQLHAVLLPSRRWPESYSYYVPSIVNSYAEGVGREALVTLRRTYRDEANSEFFQYDEDYFPEDTLERIQAGPRWLCEKAQSSNSELPPNEHRLMLAHGIEYSNNRWCREYVELCQKLKARKGGGH
jgi:hypothetical protein